VNDPRPVKLENTEITNFTIANNREFYNQKEEKRVETTHFFDCKGFGGTAKVANQYLKKGKEVLITGTLEQEKWEDKETKENRSKVIIKIIDFEFLGAPSGDKSENEQEETTEKPEPPKTRRKSPF
jgi:single-strand DNA-binding protein